MESSDIPETSDTKPFVLKKWNAIATWSWDVECDSCAICRVHLMEPCLRCQSDSKTEECVVVWGDMKRITNSKKNNQIIHRSKYTYDGLHHDEYMYDGECNHCFHNCCMALWVKQNNRCPLCQQDWQVQKIGQ